MTFVGAILPILWLLVMLTLVILGVYLIILLIQTLKKVNRALDIYLHKNNYY